jgi:hypothetical protein
MFVLFLFGHCNVCPKKNKHYNGQREKEQTLQWPKRKRTNITMTKEKKDKHYNDQREKGQTLRNVCPFSLWPL